MLKWLKETLLKKHEYDAIHRAMPEPYQYPRLVNYISPKDGTVSSKIQEINNRREYMLVICQEMLEMLKKIHKESKSLDLNLSEYLNSIKSEAKSILLKHLISWAFPSHTRITQTIFVVELHRIFSSVLNRLLDNGNFLFYKNFSQPPEISEELLFHERGDRIPYRNCYIYVRLFCLLLDNLDILSSLTLSLRKTQLSYSDLQELESLEFLKRDYSFQNKLNSCKWRPKNIVQKFPQKEFQKRGTLFEKFQTSLKLETISMETCQGLLNFIFDPVKGQKRVVKFVYFCAHPLSSQAVKILFLASKCDSAWLGELMKQIILQEMTTNVNIIWRYARKLDNVEEVNLCEEVLKDWSDNFGSSMPFELSFQVRKDYVGVVAMMNEYYENLGKYS